MKIKPEKKTNKYKTRKRRTSFTEYCCEQGVHRAIDRCIDDRACDIELVFLEINLKGITESETALVLNGQATDFGQSNQRRRFSNNSCLFRCVCKLSFFITSRLHFLSIFIQAEGMIGTTLIFNDILRAITKPKSYISNINLYTQWDAI